MNTLLLTADELRSQHGSGRRRACVGGARARHLIEGLGVEPGARVRVAVVDEALGWAEVVSCERDRVEVEFVLDDAPAKKLPLTLIAGLTRPKAARRLLVDAAAAGVERVVLVGTWRVPKSYWQSPSLQPAAIDADVARGVALAGDCILPRVDTVAAFKPFAEDVLPRLVAGSTALVAVPEATERCERAQPGPVVLCIGPDRGFTDYERDLLMAAGCRPVSLGHRTLRVHAAVHVAIGRLF